MLQVKVVQPTVFKQRAVQSGDLPDNLKFKVGVGDLFAISQYDGVERGHLRFTTPTPLKGAQIWYAYAEHVQVIADGKVAFPAPTPKQVKLSVPYLSQTDNTFNPFGSCNVTSTAMVLKFLNVKRNPGYTDHPQFEDELYAYCDDHGLDRHDPNGLMALMRAYGVNDNFKSDATLPGVKDWLNTQRKPVITHGYFTSSGHVVVLTGFDDSGFFVNDPYGEWNDWGYDQNSPGDNKGAGVHYSYDLIRQVCLPDGAFWVHFVCP